jgi:ABC-type transport system involved in multi-copper enzyme maturation permease subunit
VQRILAISFLTLRAAFRFRVVLVMALLLLGGVVLLPLIIKDDGTARGFTQIILTYTLALTTTLLGFATLWLSCGILAREIEEAQMQMVVVKPIARWQIWLGKWLGIMILNAMLITIAGGAIYALMQVRARKLTASEQTILRNEVFVARKVAMEAMPDYEAMAAEVVRERLKQGPPPEGLTVPAVQTIIREQLKSRDQLVPPNQRRIWEIYVGDRGELQDRPMTIRARFDPPVPDMNERFMVYWEFGDLTTKNQYRTNFVMPAESYVEFPIPANLVNEKGELHIRFDNLTEKALLFPDDGLQVMYRIGGFGGNFVRGLGIIFCWLAVLAALGLTGASFLSFPVAAFCTIGVLILSLSTGTLRQIVEEDGIVAVDPNTGRVEEQTFVNQIAVPIAKGMLGTFNLARGFSPIDNLSSGRAITWTELSKAFLQICVILGGFLAAIGIAIFTRRELATAQK